MAVQVLGKREHACRGRLEGSRWRPREHACRRRLEAEGDRWRSCPHAVRIFARNSFVRGAVQKGCIESWTGARAIIVAAYFLAGRDFEHLFRAHDHVPLRENKRSRLLFAKSLGLRLKGHSLRLSGSRQSFFDAAARTIAECAAWSFATTTHRGDYASTPTANRARMPSASRSEFATACFDKQQAPEHEQVPPPQTGTALRLHVAEQPVAARDRTQAFRMHRAVFNSAMQQATVPVLAAYSKLAQAEVNGPLSSKRVVEWQKDTSTAACQVCRRGFTQLIRRHHCRLCGSVVCAECSSKRNAHPWEGSFSYRSCTSCHHLVSRVARAAEFTSARERAAAKRLYDGIRGALRGGTQRTPRDASL